MEAKKQLIYLDDAIELIRDALEKGDRDLELAVSLLKVLASHGGAVDAVEVVHGRWVIQRYYGGMRKGMVARVVCSECFTPNEETNYCPNCGAIMDLEVSDNA